jgi:transposase InsO family protein
MEKLRDHQMLPSMSRPSNPYDNATCESFLKTLKREEIYAGDYRDLGDLNRGVEEFIERYYTLVGYIRRWAIARPGTLNNRKPKQALVWLPQRP